MRYYNYLFRDELSLHNDVHVLKVTFHSSLYIHRNVSKRTKPDIAGNIAPQDLPLAFGGGFNKPQIRE